MRTVGKMVGWFNFTAIWLAVGSSTANADQQLERKGAELAQKHCQRCHVIDADNLFAGISSTPSFPLLVNNFPDWQERFGSFHTRLPHPSIVQFKGEKGNDNKPVLYAPFELEYSDIDALVAYASTLKRDQ